MTPPDTSNTLPRVVVADGAAAGEIVCERAGVGDTNKADTKPATTKRTRRVIDNELYTIHHR
jgi:hypothetical protein